MGRTFSYDRVEPSKTPCRLLLAVQIVMTIVQLLAAIVKTSGGIEPSYQIDNTSKSSMTVIVYGPFLNCGYLISWLPVLQT